jgi:hypothetical protein
LSAGLHSLRAPGGRARACDRARASDRPADQPSARAVVSLRARPACRSRF